MEKKEQKSPDINCLVEPKQEMMFNVEIDVDCWYDNKDFVIPKEELSDDTGLHLDTAALNQQMNNVFRPIKTETTLCKEVNQIKSSDNGLSTCLDTDLSTGVKVTDIKSKGVPLTKDETLVLIQLVKAHKIVTSKATNATNNQLKEKAWLKITEEFNSSITSGPRETKQLRLKWENMKKTARKRTSYMKLNQHKTGGSKPDYIPRDDTLDQVASILGDTCEGTSAPYGGDPAERVQAVEPVACTARSGGSIPDAGFAEGPTETVVINPPPVLRRKFMFGSSSKKAAKHRKASDEMVASAILRNTAVAQYYARKRELLDAQFQEQKLKILKLQLENAKLKIEIENMKKY